MKKGSGHEVSYLEAIGITEDPLRWLYMLAFFTTVLLTAELYTGHLSNSLALLGDAGHVLLDLLGYGTAIMCEVIKKATSHNRRAVAALDLGVCLLSIAAVLGCMSWLFESAVHRLVGGHDSHGVHEDSGERATGFELVWQDLFKPKKNLDISGDVNGRLVFYFAACSMCVNASMGLCGYYFVKNNHGSWSEWLHAIVHPGCAHGGCAEDHSAENHSASGVVDESASRSRRAAAPVNLNLVVTWMHVTTDACKDLLLLVVSFFMMEGYLSSKVADAASAIAVMVLVLIGSVWLLPAMWMRFKQVFWGLETADLDAEREPLVQNCCQDENCRSNRLTLCK